MRSTRRWTVVVAMVVGLLTAGCSGSDEPSPPSQADLVARLTHDDTLQGVSLLVKGEQLRRVRVCVARGLREHGDASDLRGYIAGKKTFAQVGGKVATIPQDCVREQIENP